VDGCIKKALIFWLLNLTPEPVNFWLHNDSNSFVTYTR